MKKILRSLSKLNTFGTIIFFFYLIVIFSTSCLNSKNDKQSLQSDASLKEVDTLFKKANAFIEADPKLVLKYIDTVNSINKNNYLIETEIQALYLKGKCYRMLAKNKEAYANIYKSLQKAEEVNNKYYKVLNLNEISQIKFNENKYNEADSLLDISEEIAQKNDFKKCLSAISNSKAIIAENKGQKIKAIQLYLKTLDYYNKDKNEKSEAVIYNNIGLLYRSMANYSESLKFLKIALILNKKNNFTGGLAESYNNLGAVYQEMNSTEKSLEAYKLSIILYKHVDRSADLAKIYLNMANLLCDKKEFIKAEKYYDSSLVICKQYNIAIGIILNEINRGGLYAKMGKHQQAIIYLKSSLEKVKKFNLIDYESSIDLLLVDSYKALGNTKEAFLHLENYNRIKDSTSGIEVKKQIAELQTKYNKAEQEAEILLLNEKLLIEKAKNRLMIIMILIGGIVLLIIAFMLILQKRRYFYKNKMEQQEHENTKLNLELKNKELITNALHLASLVEYSNKLGLSLNEILVKEVLDRQSLNKLFNQISNMIPKEAWTDFETRFEHLHEAFLKKLLNAYPEFSPAEIKICSFLRLNMTTKDIALLTHRSLRTIENQRISIRKKMNLSANESLENLLLQI